MTRFIRRLLRRVQRLSPAAFVWLLILAVVSASVPAGILPAPLPGARLADGETLTSPRYISGTVMPDGNVGLIFENQNGSSGETRFLRYTGEHALASSVQLSTAAPWYPELAVLGTTLVAAYVDTRSPNTGKLVIRTSSDSGATWSAESYPFGSETFSYDGWAPRLVASHAGTTLYLFTAADNAVPSYRSTTDLATWTTPAAAGNSSMHVVTGNQCGNGGQECYRAHPFEFMETATAGSWVYITKSAAGYGQSGRGTQVGSLGGSWSTQVDHEGSGTLSGGGESTATTFLDRSGNVFYIRAGGFGEYLYYQESTDGGLTWGPKVQAYTDGAISNYTAAAPIGLYVAGYTMGEYVWFAGFGGAEDSLRVIPLWPGPQSYQRSGTTRIIGSGGSDIDAASAYPHNFGDQQSLLGAGGYTTAATDLALPGRLLPLSFTRTYNSGDENRAGALGPGWSHSFEISVSENGDEVTVRRGSGARDTFERNTDGSYRSPEGVSDTLAKNGDGSFTLTTREQVKYELGKPASGYATLVSSATPTGYWRLGESSGTTTTDATSNHLNGTLSGTYTLGTSGALTGDTSTAVRFAGGYSDMGTASNLNITGTALTIEFWAKGTPGTFNYLISRTNGSGQGYAIYTGNDAQLHFYIGRPGGLHITGGVTGVWDGSWHHVAAVYDGTAMRIYVDGTQRLSEGETGAIASYTGNFRMAGYNGGGLAYSGSLDEVAIYPRALPASEVADHYAASILATGVLTRVHEPAGNEITLGYTGTRLSTVTDTAGRQVSLAYNSARQLVTLTDNASRYTRYGYDGSGRLSWVWDRSATASAPTGYATRVAAGSPAAYWRLGESSGASAADASGNGNTGTYTGTVTLGASGAITGDSNTAVSVAGAGYVAAPATGGLNVTGSAITVEGWVKGTSQAAYTYIASKYDGTSGYALYSGPSATLAFFVVTSSSGLVRASSPVSPWDNQWHYVAGIYDGTSVSVAIDGTVMASSPASGTILSSSSVAFNLGRYSLGGYAYSGSLDEFAVRPSALSGTDLQTRFYGPPSWIYQYDGSTRHLLTITDPDGRTIVTNTYGGYGRLATQKDGLNNTTSFSYGTALTITDPRSHDTTETFDSRSRLLTMSDVLSGTTYTTTYTYDACGNRSSVTDRRGNRTDYTYDTSCQGNLLEIDEPQLDPSTPRFATTWEYDSKNNPTLRTDAKGYTTTWTYDATSNVRLSETREIDATTSATTKWIYADSANPGLPTRVVAPRGNTTGTPDTTYSTLFGYDSSGNLTSATDADGSQTTYGYDALGRRTSMVDPDGNVTGGTPSQHTWTTAYDALDRVTSETDPLGHSTGYGYDGAGHRTSLTDKNSNVTSYTYDAAGRLATIAQKPDPIGSPSTVYTTTLTRDANGNVTRVEQGNGVQTDYAYDALDRLTTTTTHPASGTDLATTLTLDGNGNVTNRHTADGVDTAYTYDNLARLTQISATGLSTISYAYNELSQRTSMTDGTGTTTYAYDRMGRLTSAAQPNGTLGYGYDRDSNRTTLTYPGSSSVTYSFSNAGRLASLTDWGSRTSSYTYYASGLAHTVTLPNGMVTTYGYDRAQRLTSLTNVLSGTTITSHSYTVDNEGNRTALSEYVSGITSGSADSFGFTYDGLERLTAVTTTNAETFTLDGASNITARTGPSATYTIDGANRPTSDGTNTLTWSDADRLTGRGSDSFGFDALDRLTSSTVSGTSRSYAYNGDGLLQSRTTGVSTVNFLWDPAARPERLLVSGSDKIVYGLGPLYSVNGTTVTTYARDGQKSVRAEMSGSTVTGSWRYRAYGDIVQSSGTSTPAILGYASQLLDPSGLYYMRARWYDATNQRFITRDPADSGVTSAFEYSSANPFAYYDPAGADPVGIDPSVGGSAISCPPELCGFPRRPSAGVAALDPGVVGPTAGGQSDVAGQPVTLPAFGGGYCEHIANCGYFADGVLIVQNAAGALADVIDFYSLGQGDTLTLNAYLILSHGTVTEGDELYRHEMGHVAQARELGLNYIATYAIEFAAVWADHRGEAYKYHPMEIDANLRAGLPRYWHVHE